MALWETAGVHALRELRIIAVREALGEIVGSDVLIETALRALLEGVETPTLPLLAGLGRSEEGEAHDLFRRVADELGIAPPSPLDTTAARWDLVRWVCEGIVEGKFAQEWGGSIIWYDGWNELGHPDSLQRIVGAVSEFDDWNPTWDVDRDDLRRVIVDEASGLLAGPWTPDIGERFADAVALWRLSPSYTTDVIDGAAACLVAGADTPSLRLLAGASPKDSQFTLEPIISGTLSELRLPVRDESEQSAAMRAMARRYTRGDVGAKDLTDWAHKFIGHDGDDRCQAFVELDDIFDVEVQHEALDQQLRPEVEAFLRGLPSPMDAATVVVAPATPVPSRFKRFRLRRRRDPAESDGRG